ALQHFPPSRNDVASSRALSTPRKHRDFLSQPFFLLPIHHHVFIISQIPTLSTALSFRSDSIAFSPPNSDIALDRCFPISELRFFPNMLPNGYRNRRKGFRSVFVVRVYLALIILIISFAGHVRCGVLEEAGDEVAEPESQSALKTALKNPAEAIFSKIFSISNSLGPEILLKFGFCMRNVQTDWDRAFNFSGNLEFLQECVSVTNGDLVQRVCTAAEIKFYFTSILESGEKDMKPNKNCNLTKWLSGCEPGWACAVDNEHSVDLKNINEIPLRTQKCQPCCKGFFCPHGLTCMIPCPRGSYCPLGKLNTKTGYCDPYKYKLPQGQPNHTCGGAYFWADIKSSREVFCSAGSYCPTTVQKIECSRGHYCRTGSTYEERCLKMTDCDRGSTKQNLTPYGILLIGAVSIILLFIYNCSDRIITIKERRQAKSREAAARSARETVQTRERWKSAKDAAKKHAVGLQTSLTRTFSRKKSGKQTGSENLKPSGLGKTGTNSGLASAHNTDVTEMVHEIEKRPDEAEGITNLEIGDMNTKKTKAKKLNTRSQIFKYAYGQIEKEKAMHEINSNLTFSGVISMGNNTNVEVRKRPLIEVDFKDLTLSLKGKDKHLLRCVSGKICPGRVSAVMGPSGAGKTTLLSALTGKATGCTVIGTIHINGKDESIHSYKKIIGFVPQDDIVHGNLTVEENLWFSAKCRLSADLPKEEKVLVVERVIEALGLQHVRDSLVGTVEKRGISGGQRKRVNVGLEMVMEPSLLILDEPTSGLDSSSSQLLLRALRREALEGVNICMVVHQPSYTLFSMFDDLILLAKGGLIVYLGSAKKVEDYFAGLGIIVPERVNPPDHFIDILEGITKPSSDFNYKELPIKWMIHNGYPIPPNLYHDLGLKDPTSVGENNLEDSSNRSGGRLSFIGDLWQDLKCLVILKGEQIQSNLFPAQDLSNRTTPGVFTQYRYFLGRLGKQRLREAGIQFVDYLILLLAGVCLGILAKVSDETFGGAALLCKIAALRSFSLDKLHYWRESSSGMSSLAFFMAKDTIDNFNTFIKPLVYLSMYYFFNSPRSSFKENYAVTVCLVYCVTGIAYAFAIVFEPGSAQLWSVLIPVVMTLIATQEKGNWLLYYVESICYPKWALEAFVLANAQRYYGVWLITRCGALYKSGYNVNDFGICLTILLATGVISRIIAFNFMIFQKK
ncbi:hypothetical protein V2J09_014566, partial [Rumex salicifolius]